MNRKRLVYRIRLNVYSGKAGTKDYLVRKGFVIHACIRIHKILYFETGYRSLKTGSVLFEPDLSSYKIVDPFLILIYFCYCF